MTKLKPNTAYDDFMNTPSDKPNYIDPWPKRLERKGKEGERFPWYRAYPKQILSTWLTDQDDTGPLLPEWVEHWKGMPDFKNEAGEPFDSVEGVDDEDVEIGEETKKAAKNKNLPLRWMDDNHTLPRYPVYIISKNRAQYMKTSKSLAKIKIPHYIAVEPQDMEAYKEALIKFGLSDYARLLELPFSNHGEGPGRARNWCWDNSMKNGFERHWVFDDNINDFFRLHQNVRVRVDSGAIFRAAEDFVERYDNVPLASLGYRHDYAPKLKWAPYRMNTRNYSALLIENTCPYRWEGKYNEDTILSLKVLQHKEPKLCTVEFSTFLQGKEGTQTSAGGNTQEFYHEGTFPKSKFLYDKQPVDSRVWFNYGRWHHKVDYSKYTQQLSLKEGVEVPEDINNYGMRFISNWTDPEGPLW